MLREQPITPGTAVFIECKSEENNYAVVFEDDTDTGYFYAMEIEPATGNERILDALHIYQIGDEDTPQPGILRIMWSTDWLKCALIIDNNCHAIFDFENHGGYNLTQFPPPNEIWTQRGREMSEELVIQLFGK
jgi:hypothetical protein